VRTLRPPTAESPEAASVLRRGVTAMLRRRVRWLPEAVPARTVLAARLFPILLHASFERAHLRDDAPGVAGMRYRRSWGALARAFDLPPPFRAQRGTPLVDAVFGVPSGDGLRLVVVAASGLRPSDLSWVEERVGAAIASFVSPGTKLTAQVLDADQLARDPLAVHGLVAFGAFLGGRLAAGTWAALEAMARRPVEPRVTAAMAASAPTELAALNLTLLCERPCPAPYEVAARLLRRGERARRLADPSLMTALWAAEGTPHRALIGDAMALLRPAGQPGAPRAGVAAVLALGRALGLRMARAIRRRRREVDADALARWRDAVGIDFPRALRPALSERLAADGRDQSELVTGDGTFEVRVPSGAVLGRGATPVQARIRALSVLAAAAPELAGALEPPWRAVAARLGERRDRPVLILVVEPARHTEPPFDPINRGPERSIGFPGALAVWLVPGRRPAGRVFTGEEAVERLIVAIRSGFTIEVIPARAEAHPVAARLAQISGLVRVTRRTIPVALEAGGRVLVPCGELLLQYSLDRYTFRPRVFVPDPDAPDLALAPGERRPKALSSPGIIECRAMLLDETRAAILYADAAGARMREVVFVGHLEEHLRSTRQLLQAIDPSAALAVHLSDDVEPAVRRGGPASAPLVVAVRGRMPRGLEVEVDGERYGGASGRTWTSAARALIRAWPRSGEARIDVNSVTVAADGRRVDGLLALWARSAVLRRLRQHLMRELRSYRPREAGRRPK